MTTSGSTTTDQSASDEVGSAETADGARPSWLDALSKARVWDLPVRLTHWSFVLLVPALWWSAENSEWGLHKKLGLTLLGLLVFRFLWGFVGTRTARFASFVKGPRSVVRYLQGKLDHTIGHSPLAGLSVVALLGAMAIQVSAGLFAGDPYDGASGPLNPLVGVMTADAITDWHTWFYWVVLGMVALHLTAIAYYGVVKQEDLVSPMISGTKPSDDVDEENGSTPWGRFLASAALAGALAIWVAYGASPLS